VPTARIDGALVQRMIAGGREMILGVKTDPLFGPAVVCGVGGIFVEQLRDVALRVPPIDHADAAEMIAELRRAAILAGSRSRPPARRYAGPRRRDRQAGRTGRRAPAVAAGARHQSTARPG